MLLQEAYLYTFCQASDWWGPVNYYRNLDLVHTHTEAVEEGTEEAAGEVTSLTPHQQQRLEVETLLIVGNDDTDVSLDLITKSAQIPSK